MIERLPPQDIEVEQSVLASVILYPDILIQAVDLLKPSDFYRSAHQVIFQACKYLQSKGRPVSLVTLASILKDRNRIDEIGGATYLAQLTDENPVSTNIEYHAQIIRDKAVLRNTIMVASNITNSCYTSTNGAKAVLDEAQKSIMQVDSWSEGFAVKIKEVAEESVARYNSLKSGKKVGVQTGFTVLDDFTYGFQPSDLIIVAGRPSMGKTALVLNLIRKMVAEERRVALFSLEMSKEQIFDRHVAIEAQVNLKKFRSGEFTDVDLGEISRARKKIEPWSLFIDDSAALSYSEIRRRSRRLKKKEKIEIIFIDYLGLIDGDKGHGANYEVGSITKNMKALAKELYVPVVLLCQLNRSCETRPMPLKRPILPDLRDSGSIEQDADVVMFLYRDEAYDSKTKLKGVAELRIAKQRNGPLGMVKLAWIPYITKFGNLEEDKDDQNRDSYNSDR